MANTRSGGANNDGAGDTGAGAGPSTRKSTAAAKAKDSSPAATSSSSATARESRTSSARETSDAQQPNLRRSIRETRGKNPNLETNASPASTPKRSTRGRSSGSTPETPESSAKKLVGVAGSTGKASTTRISDRVKNASVSAASTASTDSIGMTSPVATSHKTAKRQTDEHNSVDDKHDSTESGTRPSKKQKRLSAKSYTKLFRPSSEEKEKSPGTGFPCNFELMFCLPNQLGMIAVSLSKLVFLLQTAISQTLLFAACNVGPSYVADAVKLDTFL